MEVSRLAHTVDMSVKVQRIVYYHTETVHAVRWANLGISDVDDVERALVKLS